MKNERLLLLLSLVALGAVIAWIILAGGSL